MLIISSLFSQTLAISLLTHIVELTQLVDSTLFHFPEIYDLSYV